MNANDNRKEKVVGRIVKPADYTSMSKWETQLSEISRILKECLESFDPDNEDRIYILKHAVGSIESAYESMKVLEDNDSEHIQDHANELRESTTSLFQGMMIKSLTKQMQSEQK